MCANLSGDGSDILVLIQDPLNNLPFEVVWPDILTFGRGFDLKSPNRTLCHDAFLFSESIRLPFTRLAAKGGALCNAYADTNFLCFQCRLCIFHFAAQPYLLAVRWHAAS